jgi:hypothetical protein
VEVLELIEMFYQLCLLLHIHSLAVADFSGPVIAVLDGDDWEPIGLMPTCLAALTGG